MSGCWLFYNSKGCFPSQLFVFYEAPILQPFKWYGSKADIEG